MYKISLDDETLQELSVEVLSKELLDHSEVCVRIPLPSINRSNSYLDVIWDYLDASHALESLAQKYPRCTLDKKWDRNYFPYFELMINGYEPFALATTILDLVWGFQSPESAEKETDFINYREAVNDYETSLSQRSFRFPEVVDDYFANLINGAYFELDFESIEGELANFPERKYGFWRAAYYNSTQSDVFVSSGAWIVSTDVELRSVFKSLQYDGEPSFLNAELLLIDNRIAVFSEGFALEVGLESFLQCLGCAEESIKTGYRHKYGWKFDALFGELNSKTERSLVGSRKRNENDTSKIRCYASEYQDFVVFETIVARAIVFSVNALAKKDAVRLSQQAGNILTSFKDEIFSNSKVSLPWSSINDEAFEELCYDIIYHNPRFDRGTIRKMGKSRSRDGGRDIVVYTKPELGKKPKKYIFQCKLYHPTASVSTSNVLSISDVIDQYDAQGYGIMCSCYIDATIFDRLDGIASTRSVQMETWSRFEIERYLARRPLLRDRFFP